MNKKILLFITVFAISTSAMAQKNGKFKVSVGGELGIAVGAYNAGWSVGVGASAQAEYYFKEKVSGDVLLGAITYLGKSRGDGTRFKEFTVIPLRVGANYYLTEGLHAGAQLGVGFISGYQSTTSFAYSPQFGYTFRTNSNKSLDVTLKYEGYAFGYTDPYVNNPNRSLYAYGFGGSFGAVGLRLAYIF